MLLALAAIWATAAITEVPGFIGDTWYGHLDGPDCAYDEYGEGTKANPWQIKTAGALARLSKAVNEEGKTFENNYFTIAANINLAGSGSGRYVWIPIGLNTNNAFKGTMTNGTDANGKPYRISGMTIRASSLESTRYFGLFGVLAGTVDGLVLVNSDITIDGAIAEEFDVGTVCGMLGFDTGNSIGNVTHCTAEQSSICVKGHSSEACVGGLIGSTNMDNIVEHNLAKTSSMRIEGAAYAGGVVGIAYVNMLRDCHAVVTMNVKNTSPDAESYLGGVVGHYFGLPQHKSTPNKEGLHCCTASGEINADGGNNKMGGVAGCMTYCINLHYCVSSVALAGGHTMGGLIGQVQNFYFGEINTCFSSSFIDAKKATYAAGLVGYVNCYWYYDGYFNLTPYYNASIITTFAGTIARPESAEAKYGIIVGEYITSRCQSKNTPDLGFYAYDKKMCNLQLTGCGLDGNTNSPATIETPKPTDGSYTYYTEAWVADIAMKNYTEDIFYTENMRVAGAPFNITADGKYFFNAYDVTVDFTLEKFVNQKTGEEIATFAIPTPPSCLQLDGNRVKLLDPGEAVVVIYCHGSQRKVHLDINYGIPGVSNSINWKEPDFVGGDGTAKNPFPIHNASELAAAVAYSHYSNRGKYWGKDKHYILTNDIFINTHLSGDDMTPAEDATKWRGALWQSHLHGNGKTIYGLYVDDNDCAKGSAHGLFSTVSGTVSDVAVVDAYVKAAGEADSIHAGIICGYLDKHGSIERCMVQGHVSGSGFTGAICGSAAADSTLIADCFASASIGWPGDPIRYKGAGIVRQTPKELLRCVSIGKVENFGTTYGITETGARGTDCYFDCQMMAVPDKSTGSMYTEDMISGQTLGGNKNWTCIKGAYPMLAAFAGTPYGQLLAHPVRFDKSNYAGYITNIFDIPVENISWHTLYGNTYLDVINECGAVAPNGRTNGATELLTGETTDALSQCTRARRFIPVNVYADKAGIHFKDKAVESACLKAFDTIETDGMVTLREAFGATAEQFSAFNAEATDAVSFNELRYFAGVTELQEDMLSGLGKLCEVELPRTLTTIGTNAFNGCTSLEEVELPFRFATLSEGGFYGSGIKRILVSPKNPICLSIDGALYQYDPYDDEAVMLMAYPPGRGEEGATLSCQLSAIMDYAIYKVPALNNVYIDNSLPEGQMAELESEDAIIHENPDEVMHIYVNDGSYDQSLFNDYYDDPDWSNLYADNDRLDIYYPLTVSSAQWATLYIGFATELPEGLTAYRAEATDSLNNIVTLKSIGRLVPASTPVAIKGEMPGFYPLYRYIGEVPPVEKFRNRFIGSFIGQDNKFGLDVNQETAVEGSILTLGRNKSGTVGFFAYKGQHIPPYRAYLTRNNIIENPTQAYYTIVIDDNPDGIETIDNRPPSAADAVYDLQGRRVADNMQKGLYIIGGKKVFVKK